MIVFSQPPSILSRALGFCSFFVAMIGLLWQKPSFKGQEQIFSHLSARQKQFHYLRGIRRIFTLHDVHDLKALAASILALFCAKHGKLIGNEVVMFGQVAACRAMLVLCVRKVGAARSEFYAKVCHGQRGEEGGATVLACF